MEENKFEKKPRNWQKSASKGIFYLVLIMVGYALAAVFIQPVPQAYQKQCEAIDKNLTVCVSNFELQKSYYLQLADQMKIAQNQTQYMTDKNYEFGNYVCDKAHNGTTYYPNLAVPLGKIQCYGDDLVIKEFPIR